MRRFVPYSTVKASMAAAVDQPSNSPASTHSNTSLFSLGLPASPFKSSNSSGNRIISTGSHLSRENSPAAGASLFSLSLPALPFKSSKSSGNRVAPGLSHLSRENSPAGLFPGLPEAEADPLGDYGLSPAQRALGVDEFDLRLNARLPQDSASADGSPVGGRGPGPGRGRGPGPGRGRGGGQSGITRSNRDDASDNVISFS